MWRQMGVVDFIRGVRGAVGRSDGRVGGGGGGGEGRHTSMDHTSSVWSKEPVARKRLLGLKATEYTGIVWPSSV